MTSAERLGGPSLALQERLSLALGGAPEAGAWAPGRINTIGGHTDYTGGLALAAAVALGTTVVLRRRRDDRLVIHALDLGQSVDLAMGTVPQGGWQGAMAGAVEVFGRHHGRVGGLEAAVSGAVPQGAGLSSSAALGVAWMKALACLADVGLDPLQIARLVQEVEHRWVGVPCGLLDPLASAAGLEGGLLAIDFRDPVCVTPVPDALPGTSWLVLDSGVRRALAASGYATRVDEVRRGLSQTGADHWRELTLDMLCDLDPVLQKRLRHGITENQRVIAATAAAREGRAADFGALLLASHASLRDDHEVSCPELDALVDLARHTDGVFGARMMGGGFGGCVVALVDAELDNAAMQSIVGAYPGHGRGRVLHPGPGANAWCG